MLAKRLPDRRIIAAPHRLRDRRHQDFVRGVCWLHGGSDSLTTVGWDHQVLHHTVGAAAEAQTSAP